MKTQILRLEAHDDYISVRDKLGWMQTGRIVLVWPRKARILQRELDLLLIQRQTRSRGGQLALVTRDPQVRFHARNLGIPVFERVEEAQKGFWRRGRRKLPPRRRHPRPDLEALRAEAHPAPPAWYTHPALRAGAFALGVLAVLALAGLFLPSARITLSPLERAESAVVPVEASPQIGAVEMSGLLPLRTRSVTVEGRDSLPAGGTISLPDAPAKGTVVFTNLTDHSVEIPAGTPVFAPEHPGLRFETVSAGTVPAGVGETLLLPVAAARPGTEGNLPAESLTALSGGIGAQVTVTNPAPTKGGTDTTLPAPTALDRSRLRQQLLASLEDTALEELRAAARAGDILFANSLRLESVDEEAFTPPEGEGGDTLELTLRATFTLLAVDGADLRALAVNIAQARQQPGYRLLEDSLRWSNRSIPALEEGERAAWRLLVSWKQRAALDEEEARSLALGQSPEAARARLLESLPLAAPPTIEITPPWWPRLPYLPFRIAVEGGRRWMVDDGRWTADDGQRTTDDRPRTAGR